MMHQLTSIHSKKFRKHIADWAEKFKLADWELHYKLIDGTGDQLADCDPMVEYKKCVIRLCRDWDISPTSRALDQAACHEVLHILLAPLMALAYDRYATEKQLDDAEHDIIRALERVLF